MEFVLPGLTCFSGEMIIFFSPVWQLSNLSKISALSQAISSETFDHELRVVKLLIGITVKRERERELTKNSSYHDIL